ncbi:diphosphoinositol polyphosphate phosphohydrolase 1-like [Styela clava]
MKLKLDQTRTYDKDGLRRRAACLCLRSKEKIEILLVTSSRHSHLWIVPGGGLDPGEGPSTAALREAHEEAGVNGKILELLDIFENSARKTRTYVYVVLVESLNDEYDDAKNIGRMRKWFTLDDACAQLQVHKPVQMAYIRTYMKRQTADLSLTNDSFQNIDEAHLLNCECDKDLTKCDHACHITYNNMTLNTDSTNVPVQ